MWNIPVNFDQVGYGGLGEMNFEEIVDTFRLVVMTTLILNNINYVGFSTGWICYHNG